MPKVLLFKPENIYDELLKEEIIRIEKERMKNEIPRVHKKKKRKDKSA